VPLRAPHLHQALRDYCLGSFRLLAGELEQGGELPFSFEEHRLPGRPSLYDYRPLVADFVEARARELVARDDARFALDELRREPAASIFARDHAGTVEQVDESLLRSVLLPLLTKTAEACGGFDWDDEAFDRSYAELEHSLFGERRSYAALAPVVGLTLGAAVELGSGLSVRHMVGGEFSDHWAEASRLLPPGYGREPARLSLIELKQAVNGPAAGLPDAPGEMADAITAIRLATAGPVAAGPVLFERLDWRPLGVRPVLPIASTQPNGEPTRLDPFRGKVAGELRARLPHADEDGDLGEALDRWELSLFQGDPFRSEQLRAALTAGLGAGDGGWAAAARAAVLLGEGGRERASLLASLRRLARVELADELAADAVRRTMVEVLLNGDRRALVEALDETLLGVRPRPTGRLARTG
jgi:hypothetical protein